MSFPVNSTRQHTQLPAVPTDMAPMPNAQISNAPVVTTSTQPLSFAPKTPNTLEELVSKGVFRQTALNQKLDASNPRVKREDAERAPSSTHDESRREATILQRALDKWERENKPYTPSGNRFQEESSANELHDDLEAWARVAQADMDVSKNVADAMLAQTQESLTGEAPLVDIPQDATLSKWNDQVNSAFRNLLLETWAELENVDPASLRYDTSTGMLHAKTHDGASVSFHKDNFSPNRPEFRDALLPIIAVGNVVAPEGGAVLRPAPVDKAPLDMVQSFYGVDSKETDIEKVHARARELLERKEFPEQEPSSSRTPAALEKLENDQYDLEKNFRDNHYDNEPRLAIEVSQSGDGGTIELPS